MVECQTHTYSPTHIAAVMNAPTRTRKCVRANNRFAALRTLNSSLILSTATFRSRSLRVAGAKECLRRPAEVPFLPGKRPGRKIIVAPPRRADDVEARRQLRRRRRRRGLLLSLLLCHSSTFSFSFAKKLAAEEKDERERERVAHSRVLETPN